MTEYTKVSARVTTTLYQQLNAKCLEQDVNMSQTLRKLITQWVKQDDKNT